MARAFKEHAQDETHRSPGDPPVEFEETLARLARESRMPFPQPDPFGISRRDLLKAGGLFGVGFALSACTSGKAAGPSSSANALAKPTPHDARVVVIGAGLAGVTAAYRLAQAGVPVELYEARNRIGGRCWTARGFADGQIAEHGGEFIDTRHVHILQLARQLGLTVDDLFKGASGSFSPNWVKGGYLTHDIIRPQMQRISAKVAAVARRMGVFDANGTPSTKALSYGTATPGAVRMDQLSMAEWLDGNLPGVLQSSVGQWLDESMCSWYGLNMDELSALTWIDYFVIPAPGADERWHVRGGNDQITTSAASKLPQGSVHLETPLRSIRRTGTGTYQLTFDGIGPPVAADLVILTLPFSTLRQVDIAHAGFSPHKVAAINDLAMGYDAKVLVQYDRRPRRMDGWSGTMVSADPDFDTWESSAAQPGKAGLVTVYGGGRTAAGWSASEPHGQAPKPLADEVLDRIDQAVPHTKMHFNGRAWADLWPRDPWTNGAFAAFGVGQYTRFLGGTSQPEGNVHFAGEATSTYSQGYLNGGVESGDRVAEEILKKLGRPVPEWLSSLPH